MCRHPDHTVEQEWLEVQGVEHWGAGNNIYKLIAHCTQESTHWKLVLGCSCHEPSCPSLSQPLPLTTKDGVRFCRLAGKCGSSPPGSTSGAASCRYKICIAFSTCQDLYAMLCHEVPRSSPWVRISMRCSFPSRLPRAGLC